MEQVPPTNLYVAVVDDDESYCRSLVRLLRAAGYRPVTYGSAEAFLDDPGRPRFDCLLVDIALGGASGLELVRRLSAAGSTVPVIYVSAHYDPRTRAEAQATGCVAFMSKLEPGDVILRTVELTLGRQD